MITEALEFQERDIKYVSIHPAYNAGGSNVQNLHFDFALLHTVSDFGTDDVHIFPICLPEGLVPNYSGDLCYVMGYGKDKIGKSFDFVRPFSGIMGFVTPWVSSIGFENEIDVIRPLRLSFFLDKSLNYKK